MEGFLVQHHEAVKMIPEVEQFMKLAREVLSSFPRVLLHNQFVLGLPGSGDEARENRPPGKRRVYVRRDCGSL